MENFDIDHLPKKNIYKTPEHFFDSVQENVLNSLPAQKTKTKTFRILAYRKYAVAASLALLLGSVAYMQLDDNKVIEKRQNITQTKIPIDKPIKAEHHEAIIAYQTLQHDVQTVNQGNQTSVAKPLISHTELKNPDQQQITAHPKTQSEQIDQIIDSFSSADIASLGKAEEQDVYLELYN